MRKLFIISLYIITGCLFLACKQENADIDETKTPIVSVGNKVLYKSDLMKALPPGLTGEDSIKATQAFIDTWIKDKLILEKASQNITDKEDIDALVEDYRKSLITNIYQERLLKEHFSKILSEKELNAYYEENKEKFKLEENIVKGLYLKVPANSPQLANFQKWYKLGTDAALENIENNILQNAMSYDLFYDRWVNFSDITSNIPTTIGDEQQLLRANKNIELSDSAFVYLLNIKEYKLAGTEAPFTYIRNTLEEIFKEQRKASYLQQVRSDLYEKALSSDEIKFYNK
ncbi:peptidyl-prolyl cis-trans isomerase [Dysgonomonas sp. 511]|uniref:peptidylprolyl isomerase n=1 Tax=Dysgonomonas sp. 511 TaxID=2302930 RepID=UPI0013D29E11|nr:peptidylprolyl isomerase [Dysgonomonas sp. 511]NDV79204.1 peptidyl-prolyl cis-trans isomerase [Dysgonomonas sp. 511]